MKWRWTLTPSQLADAFALAGHAPDSKLFDGGLPAPSDRPAKSLGECGALVDGDALCPELRRGLSILRAPRHSISITVAPVGGATGFADYRFLFSNPAGPFIMCAQAEKWDLAFLPDRSAFAVLCDGLLLGGVHA